MKLKIFTLIATISIVASSFTFAHKRINTAETTIYIYRTGQLSGAAANWSIFVDGEKVCKLSNNKFIIQKVTPGKHVVIAKLGGVSVFKKETEIEIDAEAGGTYYVACNVKTSLTRSRLELIEVTKSTATKQMEKMTQDNCQDKSDD